MYICFYGCKILNQIMFILNNLFGYAKLLLIFYLRTICIRDILIKQGLYRYIYITLLLYKPLYITILALIMKLCGCATTFEHNKYTDKRVSTSTNWSLQLIFDWKGVESFTLGRVSWEQGGICEHCRTK